MDNYSEPRTINRYFTEYAASHRTVGNRWCHSMGIPLIVFAILGLLAHLRLPSGSSVGIVFWAVTSLFYLRLSLKLGFPFACVTLAVLFFAQRVPPFVLGILFIAGWVLQFWGHAHYEHARPSFMQNLVHLLIGPFWLFAKLLKYA